MEHFLTREYLWPARTRSRSVPGRLLWMMHDPSNFQLNRGHHQCLLPYSSEGIRHWTRYTFSTARWSDRSAFVVCAVPPSWQFPTKSLRSSKACATTRWMTCRWDARKTVGEGFFGHGRGGGTMPEYRVQTREYGKNFSISVVLASPSVKKRHTRCAAYLRAMPSSSRPRASASGTAATSADRNPSTNIRRASSGGMPREAK